MNADARKKPSPRLVGNFVRSLHYLVYARLSSSDSTPDITGYHGGYKTEHASIEPGQMFPNGFLMLFLCHLGFTVRWISRLDMHARGNAGE